MSQQQKTRRVFLIGWYNNRPAFVQAAQEMQKRGYEILYWTVSDIQSIENTKKQFLKTQFHWHQHAMKLVPPPEINEADFAPPGQDLIEHLFEIESNLMTMKQFYRLSKSMLAKKHLFHRLIQYWYGVIQKFKPDIIFFVIWPHSVYDYTIYALAKFLKIKTVMFEYVDFGDRYLLATDLKQGSIALREEYLKNQDKRYKIEELSQDTKDFYQWHLNNKAGKIQPRLGADLKMYRGGNRLRLKSRVFIRSIIDLTFFSKLVGYLAKKIGPNMKKEYIALQVFPDYTKKFIYLPLHYQPECSTTPQGGVFADQILMIKMLSYCLPEDWLIYVKEHPTQWATSNLAYFDFRYKGYYEEIAKIKNVKLVPIEVNSFELIVNSQAVSTVVGSAGIEACLRLKPVLLFGCSWYRSCPGVFQVRNAETCAQAIEKIKSGFKINDQQVINFLASLDRVSYHLNIEFAVNKNEKLTEAEMARTMVQALTGEAEKEV